MIVGLGVMGSAVFQTIIEDMPSSIYFSSKKILINSRFREDSGVCSFR